ncbi:hypothetical protein ACWDUX_24225 [Streptomyces sp. NPDC003444]
MRQLADGGLVAEGDGELCAPTGQFKGIVRAARPAAEESEHHGYANDEAESLLRTFVQSGRLVRFSPGGRAAVSRSSASRTVRSRKARATTSAP